MRNEKITGVNKVLPKAGLNGFDRTFVQCSTFVLLLNSYAKNPHLRKALKTLAVFHQTHPNLKYADNKHQFF